MKLRSDFSLNSWASPGAQSQKAEVIPIAALIIPALFKIRIFRKPFPLSPRGRGWTVPESISHDHPKPVNRRHRSA